MRKGGALLGEGSYGCVYDIANVNIGMNVFVPFEGSTKKLYEHLDETNTAVKLFVNEKIYDKEKSDIEELIKIKGDVIKNIMPTYYGYIDSLVVPEDMWKIQNATGKSCNKKPQQQLKAIVMQKCVKTFKDVTSQNNFVELLNDFINRLDNLHKEGYLHCDIKPDNIMCIEENGKDKLVLIDWGFATKIDEAVKSAKIDCSPYYMCPLLFLREGARMNSYIQFISELTWYKELNKNYTYKGYKNFEEYLSAYDNKYGDCFFNIELKKKFYRSIDKYSLFVSLLSIKEKVPEVDTYIQQILDSMISFSQTTVPDFKFFKSETGSKHDSEELKKHKDIQDLLSALGM